MELTATTTTTVYMKILFICIPKMVQKRDKSTFKLTRTWHLVEYDKLFATTVYFFIPTPMFKYSVSCIMPPVINQTIQHTVEGIHPSIQQHILQLGL